MSKTKLLAVLTALFSMTAVTATEAATAATLYKDPQCGCCQDYATYLQSNGYTVTVIPTEDLPSIHRQHGVPAALEGCHATIVEGYVIEGHVPAAMIARLLAERPKITGVSLPGMPTGSPGMSGPKTEAFTVYEIPVSGSSDAAPKIYAVE